MPDWLPTIGTVGFPAAVAFYVLIRIEPALKELTAALVALRIEIARRAIT